MMKPDAGVNRNGAVVEPPVANENTASRDSDRKRPRGYITHYRPRAKTEALLRLVYAVLEEYRNYWPLTVRQVTEDDERDDLMRLLLPSPGTSGGRG